MTYYCRHARRINYTILALLACPANLLAQPPPHITTVVSAADFMPGIALNGYATIFGSNLSDAVHQATSMPYPTSLGPTQVAFCPYVQAQAIVESVCEYAQLVYAGPTQINFVLPNEFPFPKLVPPNIAVVVSVNGIVDDGTSSGMIVEQLRLAIPQPRIFVEGYDCLTDTRFMDANQDCGLTATPGTTFQATRGAVTDQRGVLLSSSNLARFGEYYTIWMTGLGTLFDGVPETKWSMGLSNQPAYAAGGQLLPGDGLPEDVYPSFSGESTIYPGLFQVNFKLLPPSNGFDGPVNAYPCGELHWEFSISIIQGLGVANLVQIPILVMPGDLPCGG
jgi:uncharacterized protein (TIGR03437 family)